MSEQQQNVSIESKWNELVTFVRERMDEMGQRIEAVEAMVEDIRQNPPVEIADVIEDNIKALATEAANEAAEVKVGDMCEMFMSEIQSLTNMVQSQSDRLAYIVMEGEEPSEEEPVLESFEQGMFVAVEEVVYTLVTVMDEGATAVGLAVEDPTIPPIRVTLDSDFEVVEPVEDDE